MNKTIFLSILLILGLSNGYSQVQALSDFKSDLKNVSKTSILEAFDNRVIELMKSQVHDSVIFNTINYKIYLADSINDKKLHNYAVLEIIDFPQYLSKRALYDYLYEAGAFYISTGNQDIGTDLHLKAVKIAEDLDNDTLLYSINKRIGITFKSIKNHDLSKKYLFRSLKKAEGISYDKGISSVCMTIGNVYKNTAVYDTALLYYNKSIKFAKISGYERGLAGNYNNLGGLYVLQKDYDKAIDYFLDAIPINDRLNNKSWLGINYSNLGGAFADLEDYEEALYYINKGVKLRTEIGDSSGLGSDFKKRSHIYAISNQFKKAYNDLKTAKQIEGKYANSKKLALAANIESNFVNDKKDFEINQLKIEQESKALIISSQAEELALEAQIQRDEDKLVYGVGVVLLGLIGVIFAFWRHNQQRKKYTLELYAKNNEIEIVNSSLNQAQQVLTVKNDEIMDSITYAKRIQAAILPSEKYLHQSLKEAFVLYLPKDIVAGDFYWTEQVGDTILFAVADCTGHGVPGAMVSVICNNALNDTIKLKAITDPGEILDNTTDIVLNQFEKSEEDVKDGMDIGICAFNRTTRTLKFAGANIPLWLVRNNELKEIKATRQPVGRFSKRRKFVTHEVSIQNNDMIYMSSDGYADQFGGVKNKKFMKKNFKNLLAKVSNKSLNEQSKHIHDVFLEWKSGNEQVDDICVMGVKFNESKQ
ncbi:MAG: SpoIIE family protein phosphatase [Crocinitomicaceae bacterium]